MPDIFKAVSRQAVEARDLSSPSDEGRTIWQIQVNKDALADLRFDNEDEAEAAVNRLNAALERLAGFDDKSAALGEL